jgi:hypothetical protein
MESSGSSKVMSVISLALAIVAVIVALAFGARQNEAPPAAAAPDARIGELAVQVSGLQARLARLEGAPKAAAGDPDKSKYVTMDAVLRDQEALVAELQARVKTLEAGTKSAPPAAPVRTVAAAPAADGKVIRAQRIEIVDAAGKVRGVIEVGESGAPNLSFLDQDGKVRTEYMLSTDGHARLFFSERDGKRYSLLPIVTETR